MTTFLWIHNMRAIKLPITTFNFIFRDALERCYFVVVLPEHARKWGVSFANWFTQKSSLSAPILRYLPGLDLFIVFFSTCDLLTCNSEGCLTCIVMLPFQASYSSVFAIYDSLAIYPAGACDSIIRLIYAIDVPKTVTFGKQKLLWPLLVVTQSLHNMHLTTKT